MKWILGVMLLPSFCAAASVGDQVRTQISLFEGYRRNEERYDRFVIACLQTYDFRELNQNDYLHQEFELKAMQCADRLMKAVDERNYGPYEKQEVK